LDQTDKSYQDSRSGVTLSKVVLPKFKRVEIIGNQNLFDALDFRDSGALEFEGCYSDEDHINFDLSCLPDQTIGITLLVFKWIQKPIRPRSFEDLTYLNLHMVVIDGTIGEYINAPNLKHLILRTISTRKSESFLFENRSWTRVLCDARFLEGAPLLETIRLALGDIDERVVKGLKSCTLLKNLAIEQCDISHFVLPLLESLQSNNLLPSLEIFNIKDSWSKDLDMTFEEFRQRFMVQRPNVVLSNHTY
jgi:hypothetical protein